MHCSSAGSEALPNQYLVGAKARTAFYNDCGSSGVTRQDLDYIRSFCLDLSIAVPTKPHHRSCHPHLSHSRLEVFFVGSNKVQRNQAPVVKSGL